MPYIRQELRKRLDPLIQALSEELADLSLKEGGTAGNLNYTITRLINVRGNYSVYNSILGVLEAVKQEFYRRVVVPYEQEKCKANGDAYY